MTWVRAQVLDDVRTIIDRHMNALSGYFPCGNALALDVPMQITSSVDLLLDIVQYPPYALSDERYSQIFDSQQTLLHFLHTLNQPIDARFSETHVGRLLSRAGDWLRATHCERLSQRDVWTFIAPVKPDCLEAVGGGQYEARWWKPVPVMDIEILKRTDGVSLQAEAYEPRHLIGGLAVRFSITTVDQPER